jgi:hypothetical protein
MKPGPAMAVHAPTFHLRFLRFETFYEGDQGEKERQEACVGFMKGLLRAGFELTMEHTRTHTRDLYRCHDMFSVYDPQKPPPVHRTERGLCVASRWYQGLRCTQSMVMFFSCASFL